MAASFRALFSSSNCCCLLILLSSFCSQAAAAKELLVGGKTDAWTVPSSESDSLNKWAQNTRFRIGDSLVWKSDGTKDSVLEVSRKAYLGCNTTEPIAEYKDGNTKVKLERSGAFYFISGAEGHCKQGQKVIVVVLSSRKKKTVSVSPAAAPSPSGDQLLMAPAVAPTSGSGASSRFNLAALFSGFALVGLHSLLV
ncbi:Early nodulin-like protein 3 [Linum grandiflorum]